MSRQSGKKSELAMKAKNSGKKTIDDLDFIPSSESETLSQEIDDYPPFPLAPKNTTTDSNGTVVGKMTKKRRSTGFCGAETDENCPLGMNKLLQSIGADLQKTFNAKKRKMDKLTQVSLKNSTQKLEDSLKEQQENRHKLQTKFSEKLENILNQWMQDMYNTKKQAANLQKLFAMYQKEVQELNSIQTERIKVIRELIQEYNKDLETLESKEKTVQTSITDDLKTEIISLQKKIVADNQQHQMENMCKSMRNMFQLM